MSRIWDLLRKTDYQQGAALRGTAPSALLDGPSGRGFDPRNAPVETIELRPESRLFCHTDPRGPAAERLRYLRLRLNQAWHPEKLRKLLITSPLPHDGKSTIAVNLAITLAEEGKRTVLLLEGDLHRATVSKMLGLSGRPGVAECLENDAEPCSLVRRLEPAGCYFLPAGNARGNPSELLHGEKMPALMASLSRHFDWILIDSPPVAPLTDALSWKEQADATVLLARAGRTPAPAVEEALQLIGKKHVLAVVLNGVEGLDRLYANYYKAYGGPRTP